MIIQIELNQVKKSTPPCQGCSSENLAKWPYWHKIFFMQMSNFIQLPAQLFPQVHNRVASKH